MPTASRGTQLYLVRHAIAEVRDAARWPDDSRRPLTRRGQERFARAARGLHRLVSTVDVVLSSGYERAWHTAQIAHGEAGWPAPEACDWLAATRSPEAALEPLGRRAAASIALVGHEPQLSSLASLLLTGSSAGVDLELKKGGVIALAIDGRTLPGAATLQWAAGPRLLRTLDDQILR